jgi:hypothetical protein
VSVKQAVRVKVAKRITQQRAAENLFEPPALSVDPPITAPAPVDGAGGYSIATTEVIPTMQSASPKIQRKESDDGSPTPAQTAAPPADGSGSNAEQLTAGGTGTTNILAPTVSSKTYSGKTLQDVANAMPPEPGSLTFDIATKADGDPITKATVTVKQVMVLARWAERDKQCKPIQAAWDRFASALRVHEDEHVKINKQQLANAHDRYVGRPQSETQDVTTELENETFAAGQTFDTNTDHGKTATPSTTIDVGVKCDDKNASIDVGGAEDEAVQAKLEVSQPGDPDEEEADRVAEQVMRMAEPGESPAIGVFGGAKVVKRCAACEAEEEKWKATAPAEGGVRVRRKCAECEAEEKKQDEEVPDEKKKERLQRKPANGRPTVDESSRVTAVARSGGQPLDADTRAFMEPRFGFDFSRVRIHADSHAAEAARSINARAYTVGDDVVFNSGHYAPQTSEGRKLLAHELTHVVQQGGKTGQASRRIARAPDPSKGEPIRKELDATIYSNNTTIENLWASLGKDLPDAINSGQPVTLKPAEKGPQKGKQESYRDLWWRSVLDEDIDLSRAGAPIWRAFAADTVALATEYVSTQHTRFENLHKELKRAKEQKVETPPPNMSSTGGVEDPKLGVSRSTATKPILDARQLVDTATLADFLINWDDLHKTSVIGTQKPDSGLLPTPGPAPSGGTFEPFPNNPQGPAAPAPGAAPALTPAAGSKPLFFNPQLKLEEVLSLPTLDVFDAEAFNALQKSHRECSEKKTQFKEVLQRLLEEDANLAALAEDKNKNLLKTVSGLSGQTDATAADAIAQIAQQNVDDSKRFLDMLKAGTADWEGLRPIHARLLAGEGGSRDWTNITSRGFIDAYFKKREEAERAKAQAELIKNLAIGGATFVALLTPAAPLAVAFLITVDVMTVAGAIAESNAADKKSNMLSAGAAAGVVDKDDAKRAKKEADEKAQSMVVDILMTALPYVGKVAKGGVKVAGVLGREARWALAAKGAAEARNAAALTGAVKAEVTAAETVTKDITGIRDAINPAEVHTLKYGPHGPERCTHCLIFGRSLNERGKYVQGHVGSSERIKKRAMYLQARGDSIAVRAAEIGKLPKAVRTARENALLREAYEIEMQMVEIEQEAVGLASNRLPAAYKGRWENPASPGTGRWYPNPEHAAYKYCGDRGIPYKNGYPNFSELALPGGEVNLLPGKKVVIDGVEKDVAMLGEMGDFELADALGAQMAKMKDADTFRTWRLNRGLTWHHRENGLTMQLVWTELHASIPHVGGASLQRGVKVP